MKNNLIAMASELVDAPTATVWHALVTPSVIKQYMFDTNVVSDWKVGGPIVWKGEWQGKSYEDKGVILHFEPERKLRYSHFSPLLGLPDIPKNYHTVTIELSREGARTKILLTQDNNASEQAREHSEKNWRMMLTALQQLLERDSRH